MQKNKTWLQASTLENNFQLKESKIKPRTHRNSLKFQNVSVKIKDLTILTNILGEVYEGEFLSLMGPSGSGKSTLLNVLSQRFEYMGIRKENISGQIALNNKILTFKDRKRIGYVMQTDTFFESLTLKETLMFHARLKLSPLIRDEEKEDTVMSLLTLMNLQDFRDSRIGGQFVRGLSGGQRRRASIVVELLTDPEVLVLDEPTSGLDSKMASSVITSLKELAIEKNKIIICSIHQPNSQIFQCFTKVMFLSGGSLIYFGFVNDVAAYFSSFNFICPEDWNLADYIMEVLKNNEQLLYLFKENFRNLNLDNRIKSRSLISEGKRAVDKPPSYSTSYAYQLNLLCKRGSRIALTENFTPSVFIKNILTGLILGTIWFNVTISDKAFNSLIGLIFYGVLICFSCPLFDNIFLFKQESAIVKKEVASHMYYPSAYYFSKVLTEIPSALIYPIVQWTIIYWMANLGRSAWYLISLLHMCFVSLVAGALSLSVGSFLMDFDQTVAMASVYFIIVLLVAGFYTRSAPYWITWLKYLSPIYYSYILQTWIILLSNKGIECFKLPLFNQTHIPFPSPFESCLKYEERADAWEVMRFVNGNVHPGYFIIITFIFFVLIHASACINLKRVLTATYKKDGVIKKIAKLLRKICLNSDARNKDTKRHRTMQKHTKRRKTPQNDIISYKTIQNDSIGHKTIRNDLIGHKTTQNDIISYKTIQNDSIGHKTI